MADIDVTLYFNERRLAALEEELAKQGSSVERELKQTFYALYEANLSEEEREGVEADIFRDQEEQAHRREAARRFAVIHLHDEQDDFSFTSELHTNLPSIARVYRERMRAEVGEVTLDSLARHFRDAQPLDDLTASVLTNALGSDERVTAAVDFDFERDRVAIASSSDPETKVYSMEDFSAAAYKAFRKSDLSSEARQEIFNVALEGKEIDLSSQEPVMGM